MKHTRRVTLGVAAALVGVALGASPATATSGAADPPLTVPEGTLAAALHCPAAFDDTVHEPVLLVHGTFANDQENYGWNYLPDLTEAGFDVCTVTLPDRSTTDIQVQSEYVVHAIRAMHAASGDRIDVLGHSQGGLQPRWAVRFYPRVRAMVDDLVTLATPHNGTALASLQDQSCEACFQMSPSSRFLARLNSVDPTPGQVDYTSIWTELVDELVQPQPAASTLGGGGDNVANLSVQSVCPGRPVDHLSIVGDAVVHSLVLDAFTQDGPADVTRAAPVCTDTTFVSPQDFANGYQDLQDVLANPALPPDSLTDEEPPTAFYARPDLPTFSDVRPGNGAYWEVEWAATTGIVTPPGHRFSPNGAWVRSEGVLWLWRLAGSPAGAPDTHYRDVPADAPYHDALDWAVQQGIVRNREGGRFNPLLALTRAKAATWMSRDATAAGATFPATISQPNARMTRAAAALRTFRLALALQDPA